ncbi:hypothetical protein, partial [Thiolapillus sp.]
GQPHLPRQPATSQIPLPLSTTVRITSLLNLQPAPVAMFLYAATVASVKQYEIFRPILTGKLRLSVRTFIPNWKMCKLKTHGYLI